jgi:cell division protein FtsB
MGNKIIRVLFLILFIIYLTNIFIQVRNNKKKDIEAQKSIINKIEQEVDRLSNKVINFRDKIDEDLLDEEIRKNFNYLKENESVILKEDSENINKIQ